MPPSEAMPVTMLAGTETTGPAGRLTVTRKLAVPVRPRFVAEQFTDVVPIGNTEPLARSHVTVPALAVTAG